jgi:hypothetical protein
MATHFDEYEKHARRLEQIAGTVGKKTAKYASLERAGWALAFVTMHHHSEFQEFLGKHKRGQLSRQQLKHLNGLGLK